MIPESRRLTWNDDGFPFEIESDTDERIRRDIHRRWKRARENKKTQSKEYSRLKERGLTDLQAYVASYNK